MHTPRKAPWARQAALLLAMTSVGCSTFSIRADRCPAYPGPQPLPSRSDVKIQYLGVGGYVVQRGSDVALFGTVYSNPSLL